jgi:predicted ATPase
MDDALLHAVYKKLTEDAVLDENWSTYVIAALEGAGELESSLGGNPGSGFAEAVHQPAPSPEASYIKSITVQGFRGIGEEKSIDLNPGPGLTLVVGRNGSGKSSFAEALEVLLTGDNKRWSEKRLQVWKEGWRNLHHPHPALVEAELYVDGKKGTVRVLREWLSGEDAFDDAKVTVKSSGSADAELSTLGWEQPLRAYRPFLSYNELGGLLEGGNADIYDSVAPILGIEELGETQKVLANARLARERAVKESRKALDLHLKRLQQLVDEASDERASQVLGILSARAPDLESARAIVEGVDAGHVDTEIDLLRRLSSLQVPPENAIEEAIKKLASSDAALKQLGGTHADAAARRKALLEAVVLAHNPHDDACPVCGTEGVLGKEWRDSCMREIRKLQEEAESVQLAERAVLEAVRASHTLMSSPPEFLSAANEIAIGASTLSQVWKEWQEGIALDDPTSLVPHIKRLGSALQDAAQEVIEASTDELKAREDRWRPVANDLRSWIDEAIIARTEASEVPSLKKAEAWLQRATVEIRSSKFEPIQEQQKAIWEVLRQQSSVELMKVELQGARTTRKVVIDVAVDGAPGAALGVMSQGEIHALALSLFLPRATSEESPFRFLVIDDPVQAMDPSRVDGLARVLENAAKTHQVVVFTHDDRLPESVRRLGIPAWILQVTRREHSVVEVREGTDPVRANLADAMSLALTKELPENVGRRVVPGFCRAAIEAACIEVVRRRRLARGEPHDAVEEALGAATTVTTLAALALFDDASRGGEVMARLNQFGGWAGTVFKQCKEGAHEAYGGELRKLVQDAGALTDKILSLS